MSARLSAAEADVGTAPRASANVRHLGRLELGGAGQVTVAGRYAYIGYQKGPEGTAILDIEDPARPRLVSTIMPGHPASHSHKVRVAGDVMAVNSELEPGKLRKQDYPDGGFRLYDIADRSNPKLISFVRTHGKGVHRFDMDERYAYISSEMEGFVGNILVIYDISRPAKVSEVGRWWMPGQNVGAGETPHPRKTEHRLHHAMRADDQAYAGCWHSGYAIIDMRDLGRPRTLAQIAPPPGATEPGHTFLKVPFPIAGRAIAASTDEERRHRGPDAGKPHGALRIWDVSEPTDPRLLAEHHLEESASPYRGPQVRFGTHQLRERVDPDGLLYVTWFGGGLRIIDINDPAHPKERGYFIPKPGDGYDAPQTNDVAQDERGLLYVVDKARGFDVIELQR
jgi:hypothetical protein